MGSDEMAGWKAELVSETVWVPTTDRDGDASRVPVTKRRVELSRGPLTVLFGVGKGRGGHPVFTDLREQATGSASPTSRQFQTEPYCKRGPVRKLTPTAWTAEVRRLIGPEQLALVFGQLVREGFTIDIA